MDNLTPSQRSKLMASIRNANTKPEVLIRKLLHRLGYRFRLKKAGLPGKPDIIFPGRNCIIQVYGCFWHGHTCSRAKLPKSNLDFWKNKILKNKERDFKNNELLQNLGWKVMYIWTCEIFRKKIKEIEDQIIQFLEYSFKKIK